MSPWSDIDLTVGDICAAGAPAAVLQCISRYPAPLADVGLNVLDEIRVRYDRPVGLSDHSGTPSPAMTAISRGAAVVELHITLSERMFGPDVLSSLTVEQFRAVADMRKMFGRSLAPKRELAAGTRVTADMLVAKKPATRIPEADIAVVVGRTLVRDVPSDQLIAWSDLHVDG